jgi:hypothetical protein
MTPYQLSIRALPLMVNNIKFGTLTRVSRTTASMRKHGIAGLNVLSDGQGNADHDLRRKCAEKGQVGRISGARHMGKTEPEP